jgi:hypothetical protein
MYPIAIFLPNVGEGMPEVITPTSNADQIRATGEWFNLLREVRVVFYLPILSCESGARISAPSK